LCRAERLLIALELFRKVRRSWPDDAEIRSTQQNLGAYKLVTIDPQAEPDTTTSAKVLGQRRFFSR